MTEKTASKKEIRDFYICSFCGVKSTEFNGSLIAGPGGCICQDCVFLCVEVIFKHSAKTDEPTAI